MLSIDAENSFADSGVESTTVTRGDLQEAFAHIEQTPVDDSSRRLLVIGLDIIDRLRKRTEDQ